MDPAGFARFAGVGEARLSEATVQLTRTSLEIALTDLDALRGAAR